MPVHRILQRSLLVLVLLVLVIVTGLRLALPSYGASLGQRSMQLNNPSASATSNYNLSFTYATAGLVGSISVEFCSNGALQEDSCTAPGGFSATSAVLANQVGATGFSISNSSTANRVILTRPPSAVTSVSAKYEFTGVINPSSPGSYFVKVQTFASPDASGSGSDYGGIAIAINNALAISATVPPYLIFCTAVTIRNLNCANAAGDYIDFGELSSTRTASGTSQMLIATNAEDGYNVTANGTTLTSGNNVISAIASPDVSRPGTTQFGFNLRANNAPSSGNNPAGPGNSVAMPNYNQPNFFAFLSGDTLVSINKADDIRQFTSNYITNVPRTQAAGVYVSTLTYVCLANF